ncbi:MAG TPA: sigma-70 family RNA polymerase sigma factor [Streptosporangiaceae bacterium]|nr:sigma-70 family RNA polymerase sigma factor [Streptosporangiaceae bacterium]
MSGPGELVLRARRDDADAWAALVERYTGMLWSIARSYDLNAADSGDVIQTAWLRLVERLHLLRKPDSVGAWLAATAHRECRRTLHRGRRERPGLIDRGAAPPYIDYDLEKLLAALPERCRTILRVFAQAPPLTYAEVAAALEIPVGTVGPTRRRCLTRLRAQLAGDVGDVGEGAGDDMGGGDPW